MTRKFLFNRQEFENFIPKLLALRFTRKAASEFAADRIRLDLIPPERKKEREVTYQYYANGHRVIFHTSFSERLGRAQDEDYVWVLITRHDRRAYTRLLQRTATVFERALGYLKACQERIDHPHICPHCKRRMEIVPGRGFGSRFWQCVYPKCSWPKHQAKPPREDFDLGLSPETRQFLKRERKSRTWYREHLVLYKLFCQEAGIKYVPAAMRRKTWQVTRPENLE